MNRNLNIVSWACQRKGVIPLPNLQVMKRNHLHLKEALIPEAAGRPGMIEKVRDDGKY